MSDKHEAAYHTGHAECGCGERHTSVLASIYCAESMSARVDPGVRRASLTSEDRTYTRGGN